MPHTIFKEKFKNSSELGIKRSHNCVVWVRQEKVGM